MVDWILLLRVSDIFSLEGRIVAQFLNWILGRRRGDSDKQRTTGINGHHRCESKRDLKVIDSNTPSYPQE